MTLFHIRPIGYSLCPLLRSSLSLSPAATRLRQAKISFDSSLPFRFASFRLLRALDAFSATRTLRRIVIALNRLFRSSVRSRFYLRPSLESSLLFVPCLLIVSFRFAFHFFRSAAFPGPLFADSYFRRLKMVLLILLPASRAPIEHSTVLSQQ